MREIKFRAWDKIGKRMGAVTFIRYSDSQYAQISARFKQSGKTVDEWFAYGCEDGSDNIILLQYSGLHDKDGVEIYEGDICEDVRGFRFVVEWDKDARFLGRGIGKQKEYIRYVAQEPAVVVIGNIYENPELLEG